MDDSVFIICEVGSNYNGDLDRAIEYLRSAKSAGASAVKFQTLRKEKIVAPFIQSEGSWTKNPVYDLFSSLELPDEWHFELKRQADELGIEFFSTPFYIEAVDLLERVGVETYKIASGDITFVPLLQAVGETQKKVVLSTGASDLKDIERALNILRKSGSKSISLLHCVANYPPSWSEMNLRSIITLKEEFGLPVGLSDHSPGLTSSIAAVALGATVIEKHVTFSRSEKGPDHPFALEMSEFSDLISEIQNLTEALGDGIKTATETEWVKRDRLRRGPYDSQTLMPSIDGRGVWLRPNPKP